MHGFYRQCTQTILPREHDVRRQDSYGDWLAGVYKGIQDPYWGYTRYDAFGDAGKHITPSQGWLPYWGSDCGLGFRVGQWELNSGWSQIYWTMSNIFDKPIFSWIT